MIAGKLVFIVFLLVPIAAGISSSFSLPVLLILVIACQRLLSQKNLIILITGIIVIMLFSLRFSFFDASESTLQLAEDEPVSVAVKKTSWKVDGDKLSFEGQLNKDGTREKVNITYYIKDQEEKSSLTEIIPANVIVKGVLSIPEEPTNFNQFNYRTYLKSKKIYYVLKASELASIEHNRNKYREPYALDSLRQRILSHVDHTMTTQTGAYTKTLLFADKRSFSSDVMEAFKELGIIHLLSISGLHVVFLIDLIKDFLLRIKVSKEAAATSLLLILPLYGMMTGFGVSVSRASGQAWIKLLGDKLNLEVTALDSWSLMLMITLFIQPYSLYTIGFQLSYLISFVIIVLTHQSLFKRLNKIETYIVLNLLLVISSIPILSYHFYEFSWGVLLLNSIFIPFVASLLLPLLLVSLVLSVVIPRSFLFKTVLFVIDKLIFVMETTVNEVASNFTFTFVTGRLCVTTYFLLSLSIITLFILIEKNKIKRYYPGPVIGIIICILSVRYSPVGQVLMLDVNQGEAILIKEPWGRGNYLIDTGGQVNFPVEEWQKRKKMYNVGENIVLPVLKSEGVHKLESIIITHPDIDHFGALLNIISDIETEQVVSAKAAFLQENFQDLFPAIETNGTLIKEAVEGSGVNLPSNTFAVLSNDQLTGVSKNDNSLVLYGMIGKKTWLFTGDIEADGEEALLGKYPDMTVDVLKVGHHGSQTSTHDAFLNQLNPDTALISSGKSNRYGHPHNNVIEKLTDRSIRIYRTDMNGAVRYRYTEHLPIFNIDSYQFSFERKREQRGE